MIAVEPEEIRKIEEKAVNSGKVTLEDLMEKAGQALAEEVLKENPQSVLVVSGAGNNGGDGLVAARVLAKKGIKVSIFLASLKKMSPLTLLKLKELKETSVFFLNSIEELKYSLEKSPLVIDALFGFGFRGKLGGKLAKIVEEINNSKATVYSADIPSGVEAGSGKVNGPACRAKVTVTFSLPKIGLYLWPGSDFAGEVRVKEVVPPEFLEGAKGIEVLTPVEAKKLLPSRSKEANKWSVGGVLVLAGSEGMTGAAILTVRGAQKAGAGIVKLASSAKLTPIFGSTLIEAVYLPLEEKLTIKKKLTILEREAKRYKAVVVGPGLKESAETKKLVKEAISWGKPLVLDATALAYFSEISPKTPGLPIIITPHEGEFSRLSSLPAAYIRENRLKAALDFVDSSQFENLVLVLKGFRSLIVSKKRKALNLTGGPALASAGTGDVLAGMIGAFLAQGLSSFDAALLSVYLHGLASDLALKEIGDLSFTATDLLTYLPRAILQTRAESLL